MPIVRIEKVENYSVVNNYFINDTSLSWKAKGLLTFLLSKPNDWQVYLEHLKNMSTDGKDSTASGIKELIEAGYIVRDSVRNNKGQLNGFNYVVYEHPVNKYFVTKEVLPETGYPSTVNSDSEKPSLLNTERNQVLTLVNTDVYINEKDTATNEVIESIYKLYPTKCYSSQRSTGKSHKDKDKIKRILKTISSEKLSSIVQRYLNDCLANRTYLKNFGTFLNQLPDYEENDEKITEPPRRDVILSVVASIHDKRRTIDDLDNLVQAGKLTQEEKAECLKIL